MNVILIANDSARVEFPCAPGQDVVTAAQAAGFYPPAMCREGSCGLCAAHIVEGAYQMGPHNAKALPAGPDGVLLCRCLPDGDVTVAVPYAGEQIRRHQVPERAALIAGIERVAADIVALSLDLLPDPELGQGADFIPGQYMELCVPATGVRRAYSLANLPNWEGRLDFLIRLVPGGAFTGWLAKDAKPGDELQVRGALGAFMLDEASPRRRVLVGGGCGLAPILAMLRHMAEFQDTIPVHLIYAVGQEDELLAEEVFGGLCQALPQLGITRAVWRARPGWPGFAGNAAQALAAHLDESDAEMDIYVCGPPPMLEAVEAVAMERGVPAERVFTERLPH
ncbi:FAD-binding oxidoreductase [Acidocella sp.]|uniref:FAD-binding oxidoreductase n=1 Tax=Acidocella sp. TaxID=50710 RepID=UPI003D04BBDB